MGCDIHFNAELFRQKRWTTIADPIRKCSFCKGSGKNPNVDVIANSTYTTTDCYFCEGKGMTHDAWYHGRDYSLFSILADVRNDGSIKPISRPRGLPRDVSKRSKHALSGGDHSHSWLGLDEVIEWEGWDAQKIVETVWVEPKGYALLLAERAGTARPGSHLEHLAERGSAWIDLTNIEMENVVESGVWLPKHRTKVTSEIPIRKCGEVFFKMTVKPLTKLAQKRGLTTSHVRFVFSFDN